MLAKDPTCAIATWGIASHPDVESARRPGRLRQGRRAAQAAIEQGRKIGAKTQRERDYIEAVAAYYEDSANRSERARQVARAKRLRGARRALSGRRRGADLLRAVYRRHADAVRPDLRRVPEGGRRSSRSSSSKYPDHPGVAHYLIHSYDAPPIAAARA